MQTLKLQDAAAEYKVQCPKKTFKCTFLLFCALNKSFIASSVPIIFSFPHWHNLAS